ncbi:MAG: GntR family transcriptional regulator [Desulfobacterales bacterium]|jgi:DNA-binding GntR family transcriptional regulator
MQNDLINIIRKRIIELRYRPGQTLNEAELARELNVSRTPVREALIRLSLENLVTINKGSSARVSEINIRDFQNLIEYRLVLERGAARLAAENATDSHIQRLEDLQQKVNAMEKNNLSEMIDIDREFHRILHDATDNSFLIQAMTVVMNQFAIILRQISYRSKGFLSCLPQVIEALKNNDADKMEQLMVAHLEDFIEQVTRYSMGRR